MRRLILALPLIVACGNGTNENTAMPVARISQAEWNSLSTKRIVFGHQSVGGNILAGVRSLAQRDGAKLSITELAAAAPGPGIVHFMVGKNEFPFTKIEHFENVMQTPDARTADVALMKFCFLDFKSDTDVPTLAKAYIAAVDSMSREFPRTTFVAVTAPLTTIQSGPRAWAKRAIGRAPAGLRENARRRDFNRIIRGQFASRGRLFDLATIEANGAPEVPDDGGAFQVLDAALSSDGGHLNEHGEQVVAAQWVKFIARLPQRP